MNICVKHGHHLPLLVSYTYSLLYLYPKERCLNVFALIWQFMFTRCRILHTGTEPFSTYKYTKLVQGILVKVKWFRYRPSVAQRVGRGIDLLFYDRDTRRGWVVSSTPQPHFTPGKTRYPFYRRLGGPQGWSGWGENLVPTGIRSRTIQLVVSRSTNWATQPTQGILEVPLSLCHICTTVVSY